MNKQEQELRKKSPIQIRNKKASFEYFFVDTYTAGIVLTGTEIKSIRGGKASLVDCYCDFYQGELWVKGMNISPYFYGSFSNHEARRDRKLLLTKRELRRLEEDSKQPGFTIVPTLIFIDNHGRAKVDIALCKGKKEYDKLFTLQNQPLLNVGDRILYQNVGAYTMTLSPLFIRFFPRVYLKTLNGYEIIREEWTVNDLKQ